MCGIAGFVDFNKCLDKDVLTRMTNSLVHRGPDDAGYFFCGNEVAWIGLGHRRLAILDISSNGHQPMQFGSLTIVYNGEVYNFQEIRLELEKDGFFFKSNSDTEVILKAFSKWGMEAVKKFNGMFAFAIFDSESNKLTLVRDRAGVKPLFWYYENGVFLFASELKSFHQNPRFYKQLRNESVSDYLKYGYVPQPHTIFKNAFKLNAGHSLELNTLTGCTVQKKYWDVVAHYKAPKLQISEEEAIDEVEKILISSFNYRMISDVPVGVFLSGGYDSSAVTAILQAGARQKIKTFTIGFHEENYNEAPYAKEIARYLDTDHTEYYCTPSDALKIIPSLPQIYDEPFGDSSAIPTVLVSSLARRHVSVCLSADGGDEVFGGYERYTAIMKRIAFFNKLPDTLRLVVKKFMDRVNPRRIPLLNKCFGYQNRYENLKTYFEKSDVLRLLDLSETTFCNSDIQKIMFSAPSISVEGLKFKELEGIAMDVDKMMALDYTTYQLDDILVKIDRAAMSVGLEGREPFLDYRLIEFVSRLAPDLKFRVNEKKYLLRKVVHRYLPEGLLKRPKKGFGVPIQSWFKAELKEYFQYYLDEKRILKSGVFEPVLIKELLARYLNGTQESVQKLWYLLMFQMWSEKWMGW
ncbi:MAG: asparagine synthase (glutamine-hydrolyzing) [Flavobacterium sp.]|nr:asparagine synthase (glutamine-hydrolyzing) [Flavobacterium sp.]